MACRSSAIHSDKAAGRVCVTWPRTRPGRPLGLPGPSSRLTDPRSARYLLRRPTFDPHIRNHPAVDVCFRHRESLPVYGDVLDPWFEGVLVNAIDDWDVADVILDDSLSLLVDLQALVRIRLALPLSNQVIEFCVGPRLPLSGGLVTVEHVAVAVVRIRIVIPPANPD